jgi:hypothetical protein
MLFAPLRWTGHLARIGKIRGAYRVLVRKHEGRRQLERLKNVDAKIILKWIKRDGGHGGIDLAQDRNKCRPLLNAVETFEFHKVRDIS